MSSLTSFLSLRLFSGPSRADAWTPPAEIAHLSAGVARTLVLGPTDQLKVTRGVIWLTLPGDSRDYVLQAGDVFRRPDGRQRLSHAVAAVVQSVGRQTAEVWRV